MERSNMPGFLSGLGGFIGPALTVGTKAYSAYEGAEANAAKEKRESVIQSLMMARQQKEEEIKDSLNHAQISNYDSQLRARDAATSRAEQQLQSRISILRKNPKFQDYSDDELAGIASSPVTFGNASGLGNATGQFLRGTDDSGNPIYGYGDRSTGEVAPTGFGAPPPAKRAGSGGTSPYTETMHNFNAVGHQLTDARRDLNDAQKSPLGITASPADTALKAQAVAQALSRAKNLQPLEDSLSAAMRGDYSVPGHIPGTAPRKPTKGGQTNAVSAAAEYQQAAKALADAGGPSNENARAVYDQIVAAIARKYGQQ
jgi:hypothetical protein